MSAMSSKRTRDQKSPTGHTPYAASNKSVSQIREQSLEPPHPAARRSIVSIMVEA